MLLFRLDDDGTNLVNRPVVWIIRYPYDRMHDAFLIHWHTIHTYVVRPTNHHEVILSRSWQCVIVNMSSYSGYWSETEMSNSSFVSMCGR